MIGVYGADGFLGRHLVRALAAGGSQVRAVSRSFGARFAGVSHVEADLADPFAMVDTLRDVETVVQLVSTSSPALGNDHVVDDIDKNVIPHVKFLRQCVQRGVRRYVFLSSGGTIYGPDAPMPTPETAETTPIVSHGLTKLAIEKYIQMHAAVDGLEYAILRLANPFGPGQTYRKGQGLIPLVLERQARGLPVQIYGDGTAQRDYVYVDDVTEAISRAVRKPGQVREIVNIGSGQPRSVLDVLEAIERVAGPVQRQFVPARRTDVPVSWLDVGRAGEVLGWQPRTSFNDGIALTHRSHQGAS